MYQEWSSRDKSVRAYGAQKFVNLVSEDFREQIDYSIENSTIYERKNIQSWQPCEDMRIFLARGTTQRAINILRQQMGPEPSICALNYASYKNPGGRFMDGSKAQEEALCASSILYPVLKSFEGSYYSENQKHLNKGMYLDRAIYSPEIVFCDYERRQSVRADILTCAAPNYSVALKYNNFTKQQNMEALSNRIKFLYGIVANELVDTFIAGAWGCGVFKQDPIEVARLMINLALKAKPVHNLIFAVPANQYDSVNYDAFQSELREWAPDFIAI